MCDSPRASFFICPLSSLSNLRSSPVILDWTQQPEASTQSLSLHFPSALLSVSWLRFYALARRSDIVSVSHHHQGQIQHPDSGYSTFYSSHTEFRTACSPLQFLSRSSATYTVSIITLASLLTSTVTRRPDAHFHLLDGSVGR